MKMEGDSILRFKADTSLSHITHDGLKYSVGIGVNLNYQQLNYLMNNTIKVFGFGVNEDNVVDMNDMLTDKNRREIQKSAMFMLGLQEVHDQ
jgi:hypothetical protein